MSSEIDEMVRQKMRSIVSLYRQLDGLKKGHKGDPKEIEEVQKQLEELVLIEISNAISAVYRIASSLEEIAGNLEIIASPPNDNIEYTRG